MLFCHQLIYQVTAFYIISLPTFCMNFMSLTQATYPRHHNFLAFSTLTHKIKDTPIPKQNTMRMYTGCGDKAPHIINLRIRQRWVIRCILYPCWNVVPPGSEAGRTQVPLFQCWWWAKQQSSCFIFNICWSYDPSVYSPPLYMTRNNLLLIELNHSKPLLQNLHVFTMHQ